MTTDARAIVAALQAAIEDQRRNVMEFDQGYESGYLDSVVRALDIVQATAYGLPSGAQRLS